MGLFGGAGFFVARGLAPVRLRSSRKTCRCGVFLKNVGERFALQWGQAPSPQASPP